jgi:hypothetical protein
MPVQQACYFVLILERQQIRNQICIAIYRSCRLKEKGAGRKPCSHHDIIESEDYCCIAVKLVLLRSE